MKKIELSEEEISLLDQCVDLSISDVSASILKRPIDKRGFFKDARVKLINLQQKIVSHDKDK